MSTCLNFAHSGRYFYEAHIWNTFKEDFICPMVASSNALDKIPYVLFAQLSLNTNQWIDVLIIMVRFRFTLNVFLAFLSCNQALCFAAPVKLRMDVIFELAHSSVGCDSCHLHLQRLRNPPDAQRKGKRKRTKMKLRCTTLQGHPFYQPPNTYFCNFYCVENLESAVVFALSFVGCWVTCGVK